MRFLVDECLPRAMVDGLRAAGHDVEWVQDTCSGEEDAALLKRAMRQQQLVITEDRDFGTLTMLHRMPAVGIVMAYLAQFDGPIELGVDHVVRTIGDPGLILAGHLTVIEPGRIRQRALPRPKP
jgi:Domain of unknown function (DUF5615)